MRHIFLDARDGRLALYLHGDLQFDARDEHLYHEPLALVPTALACRRAPRRGLRVLILGGGDGLALREVLRFPQVDAVHLIDRDPAVLRLGAGRLAELNRRAFDDPRVRVHVADARRYLRHAHSFDVLITDLTYPRDPAGASLLSVTSLSRMRAALRHGGILALNAVSPELTPQAFGCIGRTLAAAGLWATPYAFALPSFLREGYGRWGFLFASTRPIRDWEIRGLTLPHGAHLTPQDFLAGTRWPAAAARAMAVGPNRAHELLAYLAGGTPISWEAPLRPYRFSPGSASAAPSTHLAVRPAAAQGFALWIRREEGRRSVEDLLGCLPFPQRSHLREMVLEWGQHVDTLLRGIDLPAILAEIRRQAKALPRAWVRELRDLGERIRAGWPGGVEMLHHAYRVLAILLLVLVLANLFFPDNAYAKGFSSSSGQSSGDSFHGFSYSSPTTRSSPYRSRSTYAGTRFSSRPGPYPSQVYDAEGRAYAALRFAFTDAQGGQRSIASLLALSRDLQLLETSGIAYTADVPGYRFLLDPGRLLVLDGKGVEVVALLPGARLEEEVQQQLRAQGPLIEKAILDHQRWLGWVRWASMTSGGQHAAAEMAALEVIKQTVASAQETWEPVRPRADSVLGAGWAPIFPGIYLEPAGTDPVARSVVLVTADRDLRVRPLAPPAALTAEDRFLFGVLNRQLTAGRDASLQGPIARWLETHGEVLGAIRPRPGTPGQPP